MNSKNETFDYAFPEVTHVFADYTFKPARFSEIFSGFKALEWEFQNGSIKNAFKILIKGSLEHLVNGFIFIWFLVAVVQYLIFSAFSMKEALYFCVAINTAL
jgi:hypothetical protein